ncbi:MAG: transporter substrate-binding domain-containing protein [Selenomonadaceae bacterium]|nr:transporter substrate-binding domain-containing protein [Selenomonadaceae bacterium]MBQ3726504.1 transporter substrate-binding domain-containing protein [Selenomonadaceae bacterium]
MRMKKIFAAICAASLLLTGCGQDGGGAEKKDSQATIIKLGMISHLNASEKQMEEYLFKVQEKSRAKVVNHVPVFFDNLSLMQAGLQAGKVDEMSTYDCVGDYLMANSDGFEKVNDDWIKGLADNFCFAVRDEDTEIKAALDKAIDEMKSDGTLDKLINEYINVRDKEKTPPKVEIPHFEGADTIKVGVTGDLPPLDLILPDNSPAGFNTALLAEIAKRSGVNIEPVQIDSGARAAALAEGHIDVVFWAIVPVGEFLPADIDKPAGVSLSAPYFHDEIIHLKLKS